VTFLGTGRYEPVAYGFAGKRAETSRYVARALAELLRPRVIRVLATEEAENQHGAGLRESLVGLGGPQPEFVRIPSGKERSEQLAFFEILKQALRGAEGPVVLDITHGFRAQPFLAAAVVAFLRAVDEPPPEIRVLYGAFEAKTAEGVAPIWDLTYLVELLDWTAALRMLLKTGRAEEAAAETERLGRSLSKAWAEGGRSGPRPELDRLGRALREFGANFETLRTGDLLLGRGPKVPPSTAGLLDALERAREDVLRHLPPLAAVLDRLRDMVEPLAVPPERLASPEGLGAVAALARLYLDLGRRLEAAATLREGWVNLGTPPEAARPGSEMFDEAARKAAEKVASAGYVASDPFRAFADVRNDLLHAQYSRRSGTRSPERIRAQLEEWLDRFEDRVRGAGDSPSR
jgi:CRISPR-associated protein Csx16